MKESIAIDINADVAEGCDNEARLMPYLSSCNIACGGHAGNVATMTETVRLAKRYNVKIGAHPSYPDTLNFGRKPMPISSHELEQSITQQLENLLHILEKEQAALHHIKPHGALYNRATRDAALGALIVSVVKKFKLPLTLYAPWGSALSEAAQRESIPILYEAFIDRTYTYTDTLSLVDRKHRDAIIHSSKKAFEQVYEIITDRSVTTVEGIRRPLVADTFCVHGDNPYAENILKELLPSLKQHAIHID